MKSKAELRNKVRRLKRKLSKLEKSELARKLNTAKADLADMSDTVDDWMQLHAKLDETNAALRTEIKTLNARTPVLAYNTLSHSEARTLLETIRERGDRATIEGWINDYFARHPRKIASPAAHNVALLEQKRRRLRQFDSLRVSVHERLDKLATGEIYTFISEQHQFRIVATSEEGCHTGSRRYTVSCLTCDKLLHEATTGPIERVFQHLETISQ